MVGVAAMGARDTSEPVDPGMPVRFGFYVGVIAGVCCGIQNVAGPYATVVLCNRGEVILSPSPHPSRVGPVNVPVASPDPLLVPRNVS